MPNITKRFVDAARPKTGQADTVFWDDKLLGFGLRVKKTGDRLSKSFVIQYRNRRGQSRRLTIGSYGRITPDHARRKAKIELGRVEDGADPTAELLAMRGDITVKQLVERYVEALEKGLILGKRKAPKKASTITTDKGRIERHIVPLLGSKIAKEVAAADINRFVRDVAAGKTAADVKTEKKRGRAIVKGGLGTAARTTGLLGSIFSYAVSEGLRPDNPVRGVKRPAGTARTKRLDTAQYRLLGEALDEAEQAGENPLAIAAVRFIALTGCRRGEIVSLRHTEIDRAGQCLRLSDSKEGASVRPLAKLAVEALDHHAGRLWRKKSPYVLPGNRDDRPFGGLPRAFERIVARKSGLAGVTAHVLRHSFASRADELGLSLPTIAALLGHRGRSVTAGYVHHIDRALIAAADQVGRSIWQDMTGKSASVIEMPGQAKTG